MTTHESEPNGHVADIAKWSFTTRRVNRDDALTLCPQVEAATSGDLVLGTVTTIGQHRRLQLASGRYSLLNPGDLVVVPCGARYAPDQFEGLAEIDPCGADLLAGGGCLGRMTDKNDAVRLPTRIAPIGRIVGHDGEPLNLARYAIDPAHRAPSIPVIAIFGTTMNSGKTTAAAALILGLARAGWRAAGLKGTGTGAFGDYNKYLDAGAHFVGDFTDAGMASTYLMPIERIRAGIFDLIGAAEQAGATIAVLEIADGILQRETRALIADPVFRKVISGSIFACGDAVAAGAGIAVLGAHGLAPHAVTGPISASPMLCKEAREATGVTVLTKSELSDPAEANGLVNCMAPAVEYAA